MATVIRNNNPIVNAAYFNRFWLISLFVFPEYDETSSDVASRIRAVTAIHRLMSQKFNGNRNF